VGRLAARDHRHCGAIPSVGRRRMLAPHCPGRHRFGYRAWPLPAGPGPGLQGKGLTGSGRAILPGATHGTGGADEPEFALHWAVRREHGCIPRGAQPNRPCRGPERRRSNKINGLGRNIGTSVPWATLWLRRKPGVRTVFLSALWPPDEPREPAPLPGRAGSGAGFRLGLTGSGRDILPR
jgi:hypothetical protein